MSKVFYFPLLLNSSVLLNYKVAMTLLNNMLASYRERIHTHKILHLGRGLGSVVSEPGGSGDLLRATLPVLPA